MVTDPVDNARSGVGRRSNEMSQSPDPEEGLRLAQAFTKIEDPEVRQAFLRLAETLARSQRRNGNS